MQPRRPIVVGITWPAIAVGIGGHLGRGLLIAAAYLVAARAASGLVGGLAQAALTGWVSLLGSTFLPVPMLLLHGLEITADAFA